MGRSKKKRKIFEIRNWKRISEITGLVVQWIEYTADAGLNFRYTRPNVPFGTGDAAKRLEEHNKGKNRYTKGLRPWRIIYRELQSNWEEARKREKYLKSGIGKEFLKSLAS